jgi:hypothetical protein
LRTGNEVADPEPVEGDEEVGGRELVKCGRNGDGVGGTELVERRRDREPETQPARDRLGEASSEEVQSAIARSGLRVRDRSFEFGRSGFSRI